MFRPAALALALTAAPALADIGYEYLEDDGVSSVTLGPPTSFEEFGDIDMLWGNYYFTNEPTELVTDVLFGLGSLSAGEQVHVWIFDDPDDDADPTNAVPVFNMTVTGANLGFDFNTLAIPGGVEVGGGFFVAVGHLAELTYPGGSPDYPSPARFDPDGRADRSWFFYDDDIPETDLALSGFVSRMDGKFVPIQGAFAVRAFTVCNSGRRRCSRGPGQRVIALSALARPGPPARLGRRENTMPHRSIVTLALLASTPALAGPEPVPATLEVLRGDTFGDITVIGMNPCATDSNGRAAFIATYTGGFGVWSDGALVWDRDDALPDVLNDGEVSMGIADDGSFLLRVRCNLQECVYADDGVVLSEGDPAPNAPGFTITELERPNLTDAGVGYWIAGLNDGAGGTATASTRIHRRATDGSITTLVSEGDTLGATTVGPIGPHLDVSGDNEQVIFLFTDPAQPGASDLRLAVNGVVVAGEGLPTGDGDDWDNFDSVSINSSGDYAFTGDTNAGKTTDQFLALNAQIILREDDLTLSGRLDGSGTDAISINDLGQIATIWEIRTDAVPASTESLLFVRDTDNATGSLYRLLSIGDAIDVDGDDLADWIIDDFRASASLAPGLDLAEDGRVFVEVTLNSADGSLINEPAIISLALPTPCNIADLADPFGVLDFSDVIAFLTAFGSMDPAADLAAPFGTFDFSDVIAFLSAFGAGCP
eukprot:g5696.t1